MVVHGVVVVFVVVHVVVVVYGVATVVTSEGHTPGTQLRESLSK